MNHTNLHSAPEPGKYSGVFLTPLKRWCAANGTITGAFSVKPLYDTLLDLNSWAYFLSPHELLGQLFVREWVMSTKSVSPRWSRSPG
jgi:hypothetical protein